MLAPSVTPRLTTGGANNPGFRLYKFDSDRGQVINFIAAELSDIPTLGWLIATGAQTFRVYRNKSLQRFLRCFNVGLKFGDIVFFFN